MLVGMVTIIGEGVDSTEDDDEAAATDTTEEEGAGTEVVAGAGGL